MIATNRTKPWFWRLLEIEISRRLRDRFLLRLLERLLEAPRQRVTLVLLRLNRLLEERLAPRGLGGEDPLRFVQLRLVRTLRLLVRDDATKVRVDDQRRVAAGAHKLELTP